MRRLSLNEIRAWLGGRLSGGNMGRVRRWAAASTIPFHRFFWLLFLAWTVAVGGSFAWNLAHNVVEVKAQAVQAAEALLQKDLLYREWSILHGAVYIPAPNQPEPLGAPGDEPREIITPSRQRLMLLNPAVVSRQIFALQDRELGVRGHITSLNPIQPANRPDPWERQGLEAFARGAKEVSALEVLDGNRYYRMMRPLVTVASCQRCHEETGHKPGELRGGISVSVPMSRFEASMENVHLAAAHGGLWVFGLAGLVVGVRNLARHSESRRKAEDALRLALKEKQALLQEIHHRVKNNLQVVSSLLQLQMNEIRDPQMAGVFRESQLRIRCMALIHEKLYHSESLARIDLADYLRSLANLLFASYGDARGRIRLELNLCPAFIGIDAAIPLGLVANELITNCLKFAFPDGRRGEIKMELATCPGGAFRLQVADDGVGLPEGFAIEESGSIGMRLVKILAHQLGARCVWEGLGPGTSCTLEFHETTPNPRNQAPPGNGRAQKEALMEAKL